MHDHDRHHHDAPTGAGVVLDIGGDVGALVVLLGDQRVGEELDIQPVGDAGATFHTGVHPREVGGARRRVAVFPEVRTGIYELLDERSLPFMRVEARGGEVLTYDLR